jgi:hypothetical protein
LGGAARHSPALPPAATIAPSTAVLTPTELRVAPAIESTPMDWVRIIRGSNRFLAESRIGPVSPFAPILISTRVLLTNVVRTVIGVVTLLPIPSALYTPSATTVRLLDAGLVEQAVKPISTRTHNSANDLLVVNNLLVVSGLPAAGIRLKLPFILIFLLKEMTKNILCYSKFYIKICKVELQGCAPTALF